MASPLEMIFTYLVTTILSELYPPHHLLVDKVSPYWVISGIVPWGKDLLAEEESPWSIPFLCSHFFGILFTLGDSVQDVVTTTA
jgi:hypothetical protein